MSGQNRIQKDFTGFVVKDLLSGFSTRPARRAVHAPAVRYSVQ
jgi:hypothetical protein